MRTLTSAEAISLTERIFLAAGASDGEARCVAEDLVTSNLVGHDSHGIIRIPDYIRRVEDGTLVLGARISVVRETGMMTLLDGGWGFGQVIARRAMEIAIDGCRRAGIGVAAVRNSSHLGRAGLYPAMAAEQGMIGMLFVNAQGASQLVAPWGGIDRRLSANPIAFAIPRSDDNDPMVVDISTCAIAEGKLRVRRDRGEAAPPGCIVDANGKATSQPADFYGPPSGALLPLGGHKGFGLALVTDVLAGALTGAGCCTSDARRFGNGFLSDGDRSGSLPPARRISARSGGSDWPRQDQPSGRGLQRDSGAR
jgi:uncharacterized oxidoreductase